MLTQRTKSQICNKPGTSVCMFVDLQQTRYAHCNCVQITHIMDCFSTASLYLSGNAPITAMGNCLFYFGTRTLKKKKKTHFYSPIFHFHLGWHPKCFSAASDSLFLREISFCHVSQAHWTSLRLSKLRRANNS